MLLQILMLALVIRINYESSSLCVIADVTSASLDLYVHYVVQFKQIIVIFGGFCWYNNIQVEKKRKQHGEQLSLKLKIKKTLKEYRILRYYYLIIFQYFMYQ